MKNFIQSLDSSHVLVLEVSLNNDWFNSFNEKQYYIRINSSILNKLFQLGHPT